MLSGPAGTIADAELTPEGPVWLDDHEGFFVHTNHFLGSPYAERADLASMLPDSEPRRQRMRGLVCERLGTLDVGMMQTFLADHDGLPASICRHEVLPGFWTAASMVAVPERGVMYVCAGNPCDGEYVEYQV
jgi:isopenicillin-N N-acyltransferase-like protein